MEEEKKDVKKQDTNATEKKETKPAEKKEEKKVADKKAKGEKKKTNKGIIIAVAIVVVVLVAISAYMFLMIGSPKKSVETMLNSLKTGNYSQVILANVLEEDFGGEAQKLLFDKLEWKIVSVQEEGNKATVELEITNKDFKTIIENYMQKIVKIAFSGEEINEEQMTNYLIEELNNSEIKTVTSTQSIVLEKQNGKWEVSEENDFINILLPGYNEAINAYN